MTATPRITVLMTLFNKGPYVEEAVQSVLAQSVEDLELLVVDDASTDHSVQRIQAIHDPRIRVITNPVNTGRAAAANRGYDAAAGEYIAVLDADDVMLPARLERQLAFMEANPDVGICGGAYQVLDKPGRVAVWPATDAECRSLLLFGDPLIYGSAFMRREVVEANALRCNAQWRWPGMDYLFTLSFQGHTRYANLPEPLIAYRMGGNNMRHGREPIADKARIIREVFRFFDLGLTEDQLELQLALHQSFPRPFTAERVHQLRAWKLHLIAENRLRKLFPEALFEAELERRWKRIFHQLADQDLGAALEHLRLSKGATGSQVSYLAKTTLNRWIGRKR